MANKRLIIDSNAIEPGDEEFIFDNFEEDVPPEEDVQSEETSLEETENEPQEDVTDDVNDEPAEEIQEEIQKEIPEEAKEEIKEEIKNENIAAAVAEEKETIVKEINFGKKKIKFLPFKIFKYFLTGAFLVIFFLNGFLMQYVGTSYTNSIPVWIQILIMAGTVFAVGVIANFFGGKSEKEYHTKEETKIKVK